MTETERLRHGLIVSLAGRVERMGRTAVMKLLYFLQTLKGVRLDYYFTLYHYGPFDSEVLSDLDYAEMSGLVKKTLHRYPRSESYIYSVGEKGIAPITEHEAALNWVVEMFGSRTAGELEMASTIVFADRKAHEKKRTLSAAELATLVSEIKPYIKEARIKAEIDRLRTADVLIALRND
ncbi:MAG: hypothetical protein FD149_1350 [Rhodospirillaceae bacterium]|nr:MAG: hypothetical protein FD149_1350 [Rhodospirillaceae bacterium]